MNIEIRDASNATVLATLVSEIGARNNRPAAWQNFTGNLSSLAGRTVYIWVESADNPGGSKLEVGIDDVVISETTQTSAEFEFTPLDYCGDLGPITLTGGTPLGGVYSGPGVTGNILDPAAAGPGTHEIVYTITTASGCIAAESTAIEIFDIPLVEVELDVTEACVTETSVALFGGIPTGGTYSGPGVIGNTIDPSAAGVGEHEITYTIVDNNGCENSATDLFQVLAAPVITSITSTDATCDLDNGSITIDFDDVTDITEIEFSLDGGLTWEAPVTQSDGTVTYSGLPIGDYDLRVRDAILGCEIDIADVTIINVPGPELSAGIDQEVCNGDSADANSTIVGGTAPYTYDWTGPNGFTSTDADITMSDQGSYFLVVTDANDCTAEDVVTLRYLIVEPGLIVEPIIACPSNDPEPITSLESGGSCNKIDNHEFIESVATSPWNLLVSAGGAATVSIDENGELSGVNSLFVDVSNVSTQINQVRLQQVVSPIFSDESYQISFEAKAEVARDIRIRIINRETFATLGQEVFTLGTVPNTYTFSMSPNLNVNDVRFHVEVGNSTENFWIDNIVMTPIGCLETIVDYAWECREADGAGGWLAWNQIAGATSESYDPPVQTTTKEYRRLATIQGCNDYEESNVVTVEICPCTIEAEGDETICLGESTSISATGTGVGTLDFVWSPSAGLDNPNSTTPVATPTTTTTYTVTMTDDLGCSISEEVTVTVLPELIVDAGPDETICIGESVQLGAVIEIGYNSSNFSYINSSPSFAGPENLFNNIDDSGQQTFHATRITNGQDWGIGYELGSSMLVTDISMDFRNECCTNRGKGGVYQVWNNGVMVYQSDIVTNAQNSEFFITPSPNVIGDEVRYIFLGGINTDGGNTLNFTELNIFAGANAYSWGPTTGLSNPNIADPLASPTETTTYTVTVTDANGCTNTDDVTITVEQSIEIILVTSTNATCGEDNGIITITWTAGAGIADVMFSLDGGTTFEAPVAASDGTVTYTDLGAGDYDLTASRIVVSVLKI